MDFAPNPDETLFRDEVRRFVAQEIVPYVDAWEREERFPKPLFARAGELGLLSVTVPEAEGGMGGTALMEAILIEELARVAPTVAAAFAAPLIISPLIRAAGTDEQWERFGLPIAQGRLVVSQAFTEPDAGSDLKSITTTAVRADGGYLLRGAKMFTSQSPFSDCVLVLAYIDRSAGADGMALFIVDRDNPGLRVERTIKTWAMRYLETAAVTLEDCRVEPDRLLGGETSGGFRKAMATLNRERILSTARAVGIMQGCYDAALAYSKQRKAFGKRIGDFQVTGFRIVDMLVALEAARLLTYRAAWLHDRGERYEVEVAAAKIFATEAAEKVARDAVQVHGGYGITKEFQVMRFYLDSKLGTVGAGSSEIMRRVIARNLGLEG
jgi:alkylation response protein AidB-like acyl-CoA dehydrogenase